MTLTADQMELRRSFWRQAFVAALYNNSTSPTAIYDAKKMADKAMEVAIDAAMLPNDMGRYSKPGEAELAEK